MLLCSSDYNLFSIHKPVVGPTTPITRSHHLIHCSNLDIISGSGQVLKSVEYEKEDEPCKQYSTQCC